MTYLLPDADSQEIRRDVLVDFDAERLADSKASRATKDEQHTFFRPLIPRQACHHRRREARRALFRLLDQWNVHELVVPLAWMDLITVIIPD